MKQWIYWISIAITVLLILLIVFLSLRLIPPREANYESYYDFFLENALYHEQSIFSIDSIESNSKNYLTKFYRTYDLLSIESGWELDTYNPKEFLDNWPILYILESKANKDSLIKTFTNGRIREYSDSIQSLNHIMAKPDVKGLYQLLVFGTITDYFNKSWIKDRDYVGIICSKRTMNETIRRCDPFKDIKFYKRKKLVYPSDYLHAREIIERIIYIPKIQNYDDSITYKLVFDNSRGIYERTYSVSKNFPHKINLLKDSLIVYYDCQKRF